MSLSEEDRRTIVRLELQKAHETLEEMEALRAVEKWNGVAGRLYYAVFHAVNALLISDGRQAGTHSGSQALFGLHYVKTGILPVEAGKLYRQLMTMRQESEYNCAYNISRREIEDRIAPARRLIDEIERLVARA